MTALRARWRPERLVLEAVLADPACSLATLDGGGAVLRAGAAFTALAGAAACFAAPVAGQLLAALAAGEGFAATTDLARGGASVPVSVSLTPTGLRSPAAVLHVKDLSRERDLAERLAQAQRLQAVGELAAGIAHDFNNLLTAILGAAIDLDAHTGDGGREDLAQIKASALRGAALVKQLLAFGRQQTLQPRVLALNDAVQAVTGLLRRLLDGAVRLELDLEEPGRMVRVDPTQLDQVLVNLAVNAGGAMPGGGTLKIATGRRLLLAAVTEGGETIPPGRYATLEVSDTGAGIAPDVLPRIFDPFFTTRRSAGGTGLGLSTVQGIVHQSGGYLSVKSTPGEGTSFCITLPRHEPLPVTAAPALPASLPPAANIAGPVLVVDDEAPVRGLSARALRRAGWEVIEAANAGEALEAVTGKLALVVSDVIMPGLDGPALVQALRQRQPGLPALLMSGYADARQREALAAQDIRFLAKPFRPAELVSLVGMPPAKPGLRPKPHSLVAQQTGSKDLSLAGS
jgi:two-component system cell cycle sensor histidine kinase/response regulator CckA